MIIRDFYFAAWLAKKGFSYRLDGRRLAFELTQSECAQQKKDYAASELKRYAACVKQLIAASKKREI